MGEQLRAGCRGRFTLNGDIARRNWFSNLRIGRCFSRLNWGRQPSTVVFFGISGRTHHVEASGDLTIWQQLKNIDVPNHKPQSFTVPIGDRPDRRFFRIISDPN
ncbi:MAG: hypothetical protein CM1200mP29_07350 [Verrucomicrobiota bacterium]|nr:MAG: hypothetical protein CM1200mP29_07350 [Verrucomicrobiota bacterium]